MIAIFGKLLICITVIQFIAQVAKNFRRMRQVGEYKLCQLEIVPRVGQSHMSVADHQSTR